MVYGPGDVTDIPQHVAYQWLGSGWARRPGVVTTVAAARRLANAQGPGDTEGDPRRTPDFSTAVSSAITGAFQRWRLDTGVTF